MATRIVFNKYFFLTLSAFFLLLFSCLNVYAAEPTNGCHCFRNRTFNPNDTFAADGYLLATVFNSLLASEFNISKRQIIMMKMREGVVNNDLVTALYLGRISGLEVSQLLKMKKKQSWKKISNQLATLSGSIDEKNLLRFIAEGTSDDQVTSHIINLIISKRFSPSQESITYFKEKSLSLREIVIAYTLSSHSGAPVQEIADKYLKIGLSWSEIAHNLGLQPADAGKLFDAPPQENKVK